MVVAKSQLKERSTATNVEIILPLPPDATNPVAKTTQGSTQYIPEKSAMVWTIKNFAGGREYKLRCPFNLPSVEVHALERGGPSPVCHKVESFNLPRPFIAFLYTLDH